ncbi:hypothetical protein QR680_014652 [Steinernema hermaphroditum]|uniref:Uncharacterized protein n=1 Tax=Steinernema hermaphroditum TaxID=289476 RepID=A0AA39IBA4_9BILA|nr:hypothetical protein QR680_014652 [Steinernema hermaphroditum]
MSLEDLNVLKRELYSTIGNLTELSTFPVNYNWTSKASNRRQLTGNCKEGFQVELDELMANVTSLYGTIARYMKSERREDEITCNEKCPYFINARQKIAGISTNHLSLYFDNFKKDMALSKALADLLWHEVNADSEVRHVGALFASGCLRDCAMESNFTYRIFKTLHNAALGTVVLNGLARKSIEIVYQSEAEDYESVDMVYLKRAIEQLQNLTEYTRFYREYEENLLDSIAHQVKLLFDMKGNDSFVSLETEIESMLRREFNDPRERYGVFMWPRYGCPLISYHIVFADDSSKTKLFSYKDFNFLIHRSKADSEDRELFLGKEALFKEKLDLRITGTVFVDVDPESAKRTVDHLRTMHQFNFVAVLVFQEEWQCDGVVNSGLESVSVVKTARTGFILTKDENKFKIVALFGM